MEGTHRGGGKFAEGDGTGEKSLGDCGGEKWQGQGKDIECQGDDSGAGGRGRIQC